MYVMHLLSLPISILLLAISAGSVTASSQDPLTLSSQHLPFDPHSYLKSVAHCSAINREKSELRDISLGESLYITFNEHIC